MSEAARKFASDGAARASARADLDASVARVRADIDARSIVGRVFDSVVEETVDTAVAAVDVARANKPVIAGTALALAAWLLRAPLVAGATRLIERIRHR